MHILTIIMKSGISRQRLDPVLAPDQFGVARPLGLEDLDKSVTRHGVYPPFLVPTGVPWSEYIRLQRNRSRSVSSSTEALDSDHARYITIRITQHARSRPLVLGPCLLIQLSLISNHLKGDMCQRVYLVV